MTEERRTGCAFQLNWCHHSFHFQTCEQRIILGTDLKMSAPTFIYMKKYFSPCSGPSRSLTCSLRVVYSCRHQLPLLTVLRNRCPFSHSLPRSYSTNVERVRTSSRKSANKVNPSGFPEPWTRASERKRSVARGKESDGKFSCT